MPNNYFGTKKKIGNTIYNIMLFSILHSSFIAPIQEVLIEHYSHQPSLKYKASHPPKTETPFSETSDSCATSSDPNCIGLKQGPSEIQKKTLKTILSYTPEIVKVSTIGVSKEFPLDDPSDNLFKINIDSLPTENDKVFLSYELFGVTDNSGVSRSVNNRLSTGGYMVKTQKGWSNQTEELDASWLKEGENKIMFTTPKGADHTYKIKNLKVNIERENKTISKLILQKNSIALKKDNTIYIKGFVKSAPNQTLRVLADGTTLNIISNEFEGFVKLTRSNQSKGFISVIAYDEKGLIGQEIIDLGILREADKSYKIEKEFASHKFDTKAFLTSKHEISGASIQITDSSMTVDKTISITPLRKIDIAPMESGMINVTKGGKAFRFLPDGTKFSKPVKISLEYDTILLPSGYSPKDIKTFYFDTDTKQWTAVKTDTIDIKKQTVTALTTHFTDYINGIIQLPESPQTSAFMPNMMNDIKAADPSSEMTLISPPQASQKGDANISYPIKIPAGRKGMQPQLAIQYSNEGKNGWLGQGWSLNTPAITLDTRWGVPLFDTENESEIYSLNGEQLMYPKIDTQDGKTDWMPNRHYNPLATNPDIYSTNEVTRKPDIFFTMRKQSGFSKIQRMGDSPSNYYWKVTDQSGTIQWYGGKNGVIENAVIKNATGQIVHWGVVETEDVLGNNIKYSYENSLYPVTTGINSNLSNAKVFNIKRISYTNYQNTEGMYEVLFDTQSSTRQDVSINARLGVKQVEPKFLSSITVRKITASPSATTYIRKYTFDIGYGKFKKGQLKSIAELATGNVEFYKHTFEYHDEIKDIKGYFSDPVTLEVPNFNADFALNMGNLLNASKINSSESTEYGWQVRAAIGIQINWINKNPGHLFTVGFPVGESYTKNKGKISLIDMDGNGLDDIVFKHDNGLKYYPHHIHATDSTHYFGNTPISIININDYSKSEGKTKTMFGESIDLRFKKIFVGTNRYKTEEKTSIFITDANGDMLPDIVKNDQVYFNNGLSDDNTNIFTSSSSQTPNMLITANPTLISPEDVPDPDGADPDNEYDVVRVWEAPFSGSITITDNIIYSQSEPQTKAIYSIETSDVKINNGQPIRIYLKEFTATGTTSINLPQNYNPATPLGSSVYAPNGIMTVEKGQRFYFRLHKNKNTFNKIFSSNPIINYGNLGNDQYGKPIGYFNYQNDFMLSNSAEGDVPGAGSVNISWNQFQVDNPSDILTYKITKEEYDATGNLTATVVYTQTCNMGTTTTVNAGNLNFTTPTIDEDHFISYKFEVTSRSNVRWQNVQWKPKFVYTPSGIANLTNLSGPQTKYIVPSYSIYQEVGKNNNFTLASQSNPYIWQAPAASTVYKASANTFIHTTSPVQLNSNDTGKFNLVVKRNGQYIGSMTVNINAGVITLTGAPITIYTGTVATNPPVINFEFYVEGPKNLALFKKYSKAVSYHGSFSQGTGNIIVGTQAEFSNYAHGDYAHYWRLTVDANHNANSHMGNMYRGWGQFTYNDALDSSTMPSDNYSKLINNSIVDNYGNNADALSNVFGLDLSACANSSDPSACIEAQLGNTIILPSEGTPVNDDNIDDIADSIGNLDTSSLSSMFCFQPMRAHRFVRPSTEQIEKWIGTHEEEYSSSNTMRAGNFTDSGLGNYFENPQDQEEPELIPDQQTGMSGITKVHRSSARSVSAGWGNIILAKSNSAYSNSVSDFTDLNGDRYPDLMVSNNIQTTTMTGGHRFPSNEGYGYDPISSTASNNKTLTYSGSYPIAGRRAITDNGNPSVSMGLGISASLSGSNRAEETILDINGDGLADRILYQNNQYYYKLNLGKSFENLSEDRYTNFEPFQTKPNSALQPSYSIDTGNLLGSGSFSFSMGVGYSASQSDAATTLQDMNGDGLPDLLKTNDGTTSMQLNLGNSFSSEIIELPVSLKKNLKSSSASLSGNFNYFYGFPIFSTIFFTIMCKVGGGISGNANLTVPETEKEFRDFNGDGYADYIEKNGQSIKVSYSKFGNTDMLKTVKNPIGGEFSIEYDFVALDVNNPTPKWVMTELIVKDGYDKINDGQDAYTKKFVYEDGYYDRRERDFYGFGTVKTIDFENYRMSVSKFHNKNYFLAGLLKESYVTRSIDESSIFSKTENIYELKSLDDSNMKLNPTSSLPETFDTGGTEGRRTCAAVLAKIKNYLHELHSTPMLTTEENFIYDSFGRVKTYANLGNIDDPNDNYTSEISYHSNANLTSKHILSVPNTITVTQSGVLKRKRSTGINTNNGLITGINTYSASNDFSTTNMQYDIYGNLKKITYPLNENGQRMIYDYTYDTAFNKYVIQIKDSFGYISKATYDNSFDKMESSTDITGNKTQYQYDIHGRNTFITGPKELALQKPYTLAFNYYTKLNSLPANTGVSATTFVPVAVTKHYDAQHPTNDIETYTFIDGLARPLQIKKDIQINAGDAHNPNLKEVVSVSGKTTYDAYGRAIEQYLPCYEIKSVGFNYLINEYAAPYFSQVVYDELDRTVKTIDQEGNISTTNYSIDEDLNQTMALRTRSVTDQNSNQQIITESYKDANGRLISTMNLGPDGPLWTQFKYNAIGELFSYVDAEGISTGYKYDMMGRKSSVNHPDNGMTTFDYDKASNLINLKTANLAASSSVPIVYKYDFNRISEIIYPNMPSGLNISNVMYKYGSSGNDKGRLVYQKDATGVQEFKYGNMGEVIENKRTIIAPNLPQRVFSTLFNYDSWNRIQSMTYPDGEQVNYTYDYGGNLTNIQGDFRNEHYDYIKRIDYDFYEQRTYVSYGNNTETFYEYTPTLRRLNKLQTLSGNQESLFSNQYSFDKIGNVTGIQNSAVANSINNMGGAYEHLYSYDNLNRLIQGKGVFQGALQDSSMGTDNSSYETTLSYNATHGIAQKDQEHIKDGIVYPPNTYKNAYKYHDGTHKLKSLYDDSSGLEELFEYDSNGNTLYRVKSNGEEQKYFWDESNRLRATLDQNGMQHYIYDAAGERVLKGSSDFETLHENGMPVNTSGITFNAYKTYPSAFIVVEGTGQYSKHYYAGSQRIVSRIGDQSGDIFNVQTELGAKPGFDPIALQQLQLNDLKTLADSAKVGKVTFKEPKPEKANEASRAPEPGNIYFFHPDHLGTATYLTDINGNPYQFFLNLPFGETMAEQHSLSEDYENPFKFNGKELDEETGLYYYGARYYDPRTSIWLSVDPLTEKYPNFSPYVYCYNNPLNVIDPDGKEGIVLSGQPGGHGNKEHFLANGLDRAKKSLQKRHSNSEKVTWIVYNDGSAKNGHSKEMIKEYKKKADKLGITLKEVKTTEEIVDYVNNKNGSNSRSKDKITSFYYLGHAKPGNLNPGYPESQGALDPNDFNADSFSSGTWINVVGGCRTDVDASIIWDDSVVDKLQSKVDSESTINGSNVRTQYDGDVRTDEQLLKANEGKIITVKGTKNE